MGETGLVTLSLMSAAAWVREEKQVLCFAGSRQPGWTRVQGQCAASHLRVTAAACDKYLAMRFVGLRDLRPVPKLPSHRARGLHFIVWCDVVPCRCSRSTFSPTSLLLQNRNPIRIQCGRIHISSEIPNCTRAIVTQLNGIPPAASPPQCGPFLSNHVCRETHHHGPRVVTWEPLEPFRRLSGKVSRSDLGEEL